MPEVAGGGPAQEKDKSAALTSSPFSPCCRCRAENESLLQSLPPSLTLAFFFYRDDRKRKESNGDKRGGTSLRSKVTFLLILDVSLGKRLNTKLVLVCVLGVCTFK